MQLIMRILLPVGIYFCHFAVVCISYTKVFNEVEIVLGTFSIPMHCAFAFYCSCIMQLD